MSRRINKAGRELIQRFEGCKLEAYYDAVGVLTIGWGHTGDVKKGMKISQHQADVLFDYDIDKYEEGVDELTKKLKLSDNQFAALVSFAYNLGVTRLASSTLMKRVQKGDMLGAAEQFEKWVKAGGKVLAGLVKRRKAERALFEA